MQNALIDFGDSVFKFERLQLPFRRHQDFACSQKGSRIITILFCACNFNDCVKKREIYSEKMKSLSRE